MPGIGLKTLTALYFRIGNSTFGGGDPTMMALRKDLVDNRRALSRDEFGLSYMVARVTPGTNILAFCAATGFQLRGWTGALLAVAAVAVPSAALAIVASGAYQTSIRNPLGAAAIGALLAAAIGLMFAGAWMLIRPEIRRDRLARTAALLTLSFVLTWWAQLSPLKVIAIAAAAGALWREPAAR